MTNGKTPYTPPVDLWEARTMGNFNPNLVFDPSDLRIVETHPGRQSFYDLEFYNQLGVRMINTKPTLMAGEPKGTDTEGEARVYDRMSILFCGHRGSGKSTELRRLAASLKGPEAFETVYLDVVKELDVNNLQFDEIIFLLTLKLYEQLTEMDDKKIKATIEKHKVAFQALENWFKTAVVEKASMTGMSTEVTATAGAGVSLGIFKFLGQAKAALKSDTQIKSIVRDEMKKSFNVFAQSFNAFLSGVRIALNNAGKAKDVLFIVDGTDKIPDYREAYPFFMNSLGRFTSLDARFIFTAPVNLSYDGTIDINFKIIRLPMVTVVNSDEQVNEAGMKIMRDLITKRLAPEAFEDDSLISSFARCSGGCPRQAINLLSEAFNCNPEGENKLTRAAFDKAVKKIGVGFKGSLHKQHYEILRKYIDDPKHTPTGDEEAEMVNNLLFRLALMEYNAYWRAPNPVVAELDEFKNTPEPAC